MPWWRSWWTAFWVCRKKGHEPAKGDAEFSESICQRCDLPIENDPATNSWHIGNLVG